MANDSRTNVNKYIRALDKRLSAPKFKYTDDSQSPIRSTKRIENLYNNIEKQKSSIVTNPDTRFLNKESTENLNSMALLHNVSCENMKSQEIRNEENKFKREKNLKKVDIEKRERMFELIQRGRNEEGGTYGKKMKYKTLTT